MYQSFSSDVGWGDTRKYWQEVGGCWSLATGNEPHGVVEGDADLLGKCTVTPDWASVFSDNVYECKAVCPQDGGFGTS